MSYLPPETKMFVLLQYEVSKWLGGGGPNPGKAGSDTAAEHGFVNQKIQNLKKRPITNAEFERKNKKNADYQLGIWTKNPTFENWSWIFFR